MKKTLFVLIAALILGTSLIWAASSVTESNSVIGNYTNRLRLTTLTWTAHTDGSFADFTTETVFRGPILQVITNPDTTAGGAGPSDNYDITIKNSDGIDLMGGALANRDSTASEIAKPLLPVPALVDTVIFEPYANSTLTIGISNNSVNAAKGKIEILWQDKN